MKLSLPLLALLPLVFVSACAHARPLLLVDGQAKAKPISPPARKEADPVRLIFCTDSKGYRHDVLPEARDIVAAWGNDLPWLDTTTTDDASTITPEVLAQTHVVMLYTTGKIALDPGILSDWVQAGGVLVGVHSATDTLADDPRYVSLIGGTFDGHPWHKLVTMNVDDPTHPAAAAWLLKPVGEGAGIEGKSGADQGREPKTSDAGQAPRGGSRGKQPAAPVARPTFTIHDEIYQCKSLNAGNKVIYSLACDAPELEPKCEAGRAYPVAWHRAVGAGEVFYSALGHRPEVWRDARYVGHLQSAIRAATSMCGPRLCSRCGKPMLRLSVEDPNLIMHIKEPAKDEAIVLPANAPRTPAPPTFAYRCIPCDHVEGVPGME